MIRARHCHNWVRARWCYDIAMAGKGCVVNVTACCTALPKAMNNRGIRAGASSLSPVGCRGRDDARMRDTGDEDMTTS